MGIVCSRGSDGDPVTHTEKVVGVKTFIYDHSHGSLKIWK